ncbi:hypothetical protein ABKA04_001884 [Annulohypoxylon sp. FPYF3050]
MDALVAVGLAANVLQFVDFTAEIIGISNELRNNAASSENRDHRVIATHLETLSQKIGNSAQAISQTAVTASQEEKTRETQLDEQGKQSSKDDVQVILDRLDDLGPVVESVKSGISNKLNIHHSEILSSIAEVQSENAQSHAQAVQQGHANQSTVLQKLDCIQASMTSLDVGVQGIQHQQASAIQALAQVKVQNSTFLAGVIQQFPLASDPSSSLRHVMRSFLEEFGETFIAEIDKRFQATARSEMDNMLQQALPSLDEMQYRSGTTQRDNGVRSSSELQKLGHPAHGKLDKNRITILYRNAWLFESSLGILSLIIRDRVRFDAFGNPTEVYELTVQFNPSPCWLSSGCSIAYESRTDARGHPQFGLRLQSHRVLDSNHEVYNAIEKGDISRIRDMLSQKIISTSDRSICGWTLLQYAVIGGQLEICKTLVQSGADINARDSSADILDIPTLYAAHLMRRTLKDSFKESLLATEATPILSVFYRGYCVRPEVAQSLKFLEHVISRGIAQRPDSIFDSDDDITISDWFYNTGWVNIWEEILEEHGFDVAWVYAEDDRRQEAGKTTAHEVSLDVDASKALEVKRRRGYENPDD